MGTYENARKLDSAASVGNRPGGPSHLRVAPTEPPALLPGGGFRRTAAFIIDHMILSFITMPIFVGVLLGFKIADPNAGLIATMMTQQAKVNAVYYALWLPIFFLYFGWFYKNRGATPGKLALGLRVIDTRTGTHIGYWRAFFRELIGRFIDFVPILAGYIVGLVRSDKRCFHDLIFGTQVVRKK